MYKLVIKVHKLFFSSHVIKVHLRTSGGGGGGQGIWQSQPTLMCTWSETLNWFNHAADKNKGYKKQRTVYSSKRGNNTSVKKILDKTRTTNSPNSAVWPVPYACAQPYHPQW